MITPGKIVLSLAFNLLFMGAAFTQQAPPTTDAEFDERLNRLDRKNEKSARLDVLNWINANARPKDTAKAIAALERCVRDDSDEKVRQFAVRTLGQLARRFDVPCPLGIFEAMLDQEDFVRYEAMVAAGLFKSFVPESTAVLLRGAKAENAELRSTSVMFLDMAAKKDPQALAAIEEATRDKVLDVRHTARMAMFRVKDNLEEHLRYLIRIREAPASFLSPGAR